MIVKIVIHTDNAAFEDNASQETARILRELATRIDGHPHFEPGHDQTLRDVYGDEVGYLTLHE